MTEPEPTHLHGRDEPLVREYLVKLPTAPKVVIIGANTNTGREFFELRADTHVWLVEPQPECVATLQQAASTNLRLHVVPCAVGDFDGMSTFLVNSWNVTSSLRKPTDRCHGIGVPRDVHSIPIEVRSIDTLVKHGLLPLGADLVSVDTQGYAAETLRGGQEFFHRSMYLYMEVEFEALYEGQALYPEVHEQLLQLGFSATREVTDEERARASWSDVLYVNTGLHGAARL